MATFPPRFELSSLDGTNGFRLDGIDPPDNSGQSVSGAGDVNGDGVDDLLVGAPYADPGGRTSAGETYIIYGRSGAEIDGTDGVDRLRGDVARNAIEGEAGNDRLEGLANDDALLGGDGRDQLFGGDGDDVLDGGAKRDILLGGAGADIFVLAHTDAFDLVRDFDLAQGDRVRIAIAGVTDAIGAVDGRLVRAGDSGTSLLLELDADLDAANGFAAQALATLSGAAGLTLGQVLEHGVF
jgi:Ca2+-binding RTX toxin-like protein